MAFRFSMSVLVAMVTVVVYNNVQGKGAYDWMEYDRFDEIDAQYAGVNSKTCRSKNKDQLVMRHDVVSQHPVYNQLLSRVWYKNRSTLIHLHNMALNRAFFNSYILQRMNDSKTFSKQPGWTYFYFSAAADIHANPGFINGSAFYFDNNCHYPNWYTTVAFNKTIPLFAPKAYKWDDFADPENFLREPSGTAVVVRDAGAGRFTNYTHPGYKMNTWYPTWLPDTIGDRDSLTKFTYYIGIKRSDRTGHFVTDEYEPYAFFGPSSPSAKEEDPRMLPVQWTPPYFDCGGRNNWVLSAVSPVVDYMPRYSNFTHLRRQQIVGLIVMDIDFNKVDFNSCGVSMGNPGPSYLSGIDKCKKTTSCKHKSGYGFKRGGYVCVCKAGTRYPWHLDPPYLGSDIEEATDEEFDIGFMCEKNEYRLALPVVDNLQGVQIEGAGIIINSGGLEIGTGNNRKRRSALANVTHEIESEAVNHANDSNSDDSLYFEPSKDLYEEDDHLKAFVYNEKVNTMLLEQMRQGAATSAGIKGGKKEYTTQEVMELVSRLREIKDDKDMTKTKGFLEKAKGYLSRYDVNDDYTERNNVDVEIERMYEADLRNHRSFKKEILKNVVRQNVSIAREALKESVSQMRDKHIQRFHGDRRSPLRRRKRASVFDDQAFDRMMRILRHKASVTASNCYQLPNHLLFLPGDVAYGVEDQFEGEGRTALRLSHFISNYLQNVIPEENFGNMRGGGRLHMDQMFGEVLANVMGNFRIYSAGLYFDSYAFENQDGSTREFFGPWAFQNRGSYYVMDTAGLPYSYVDSDWFRRAKSRFATNFYKMKTYKLKGHVRSNPNGTSSIRHEYYPLMYKAPSYEHGFWTRPHFRCDGNVDAWVITYVSPFFGLDSLRTKVEFRGVTTVDVPLNLLEINQCPQPFSVANAFKNTARCDYFSTKCGAQAGFPFLRGSYTCKCRLGFEYWHADGKEWFEGSFVELEYEKKKAGIFSRFDHLYCRPASSTALLSSWVVIMFGALIHLF